MTSPASLPPVPPFAASLPSLALVTFDGPDAAPFLHGQLSTDVTAMPDGAVALSSYNSPKGRMLASLHLFRRGPERFLALVAADLAPALRKRLAMFVLRAKVKVGDGGDLALLGVAGDGAGAALGRALGTVPLPGHGVGLPDCEVLALPDGRYVLVAPAASREAVATRVGLSAAEEADFERVGIRAGVPRVTLAIQDQFVPQSLNFDLLGGVHFRKGCYPGQEIVARMQYLGRLKERLFAFHVQASPPAPGTPLFVAQGPESAQGMVVEAVAEGSGATLLAVAGYDAAHAGTLRLGSADGPALELLSVPYAIPAPVAPQRVKL